MALTDITRGEVEKAVEEYDWLGRDAFLTRYGFGRARRYLLVHGGRTYDSKAIVGAAHGHLPGQRPLTAGDFSGGAAHAVALLRSLGFDIAEDRPTDRPGHDELIRRLTHLKVNRSRGGPALYKPITLLWAMGRAARGEPRLLSWTETEAALKELLRRHGMRGERPRPDYPVASLHRDGLWTLHHDADAPPTAHGDAGPRRWFETHQPVGGPAEAVYDVFRDSTLTRLAVLDELLTTFFDGLNAAPLLADVGLPETEQDAPPATRPERAPEPWLISAAEYERGCGLVEERERKTRGERVARTTRDHRRSRAARFLVLSRSGGRCENPHCTGQPADVTDANHPILEVDHVTPLALGGRDHPSQMVALCPNCHAVKTRGSTRESLCETLLRVARERDEAARRAGGAALSPVEPGEAGDPGGGTLA